jgi:putative FmdB family regulatory protein
VPRYEFRCRDCVREGGPSTFEVSRPMSASSDPAACPQGHTDTVKLLSTVAMTGTASFGGGVSVGGGSCCGGGCGCG